MYRFWNTIIEPILIAIQPKSIVEIVSDYRKNTENLLRFCEQNDSILHCIDPFRKYDVDALQEKYNKIQYGIISASYELKKTKRGKLKQFTFQ